MELSIYLRHGLNQRADLSIKYELMRLWDSNIYNQVGETMRVGATAMGGVK